MISCQQSLLRALIPQPLQCKSHLAAGNADADVFRCNILHGVRFIKYDEIISKEQPSFYIIVHPPKQSKEERVIQNEHIRSKNTAAGALKKAEVVLLCQFGLMTANFRRTQPPLRTDLRPYLRVRLYFKVL